MNRRLAKDLQAWESGSLSADDLVARHPSEAEQVRRLTGLFTEMRSLADGPVPDAIDATRGWNEVRSRMAAHVAAQREPVSLRDRLVPRLQRPLAMGLAAALLVVPPVAFAAANGGVQDFFIGDDEEVVSTAEEFPLSDEESQSTRTKSQASEPRAPKVTKDDQTTESGSGDASTSNSGDNVVAAPNGTSSVDTVADAGGATGVDGQSADTSNVSGTDGKSEPGTDAKGADATPSPSPSASPSPSPSDASTGSTAQSPDVAP